MKTIRDVNKKNLLQKIKDVIMINKLITDGFSVLDFHSHLKFKIKENKGCLTNPKD